MGMVLIILREIEALKPYQNGIANKKNFFYQTIAVFTPCKRPKQSPDHISRNRNGDISSEYWYTNDGVIRSSNHWGTGVASCDWALKDNAYGSEGSITKTRKRCGFCKWEDFVKIPTVLTTEDTGESYLATFANTVNKKEYEIDGKLYGYDRDTQTLVLLSEPKTRELSAEYKICIDTLDEVRTLVKQYGWTIYDFESRIAGEYMLYGDFPGNTQDLVVEDDPVSGYTISIKFENPEDREYWAKNFWKKFCDDVERLVSKGIYGSNSKKNYQYY